MTNDEIRIAIAELCGWKPPKDKREILWTTPGGKFWHVPNYCESLDACREFEGNLTWREAGPYVFWLEELTNIGHMGGNAVREPLNDCALITASALHRCQAFLRLKGKWVEESK